MIRSTHIVPRGDLWNVRGDGGESESMEYVLYDDAAEIARQLAETYQANVRSYASLLENGDGGSGMRTRGDISETIDDRWSG